MSAQLIISRQSYKADFKSVSSGSHYPSPNIYPSFDIAELSLLHQADTQAAERAEVKAKTKAS